MFNKTKFELEELFDVEHHSISSVLQCMQTDSKLGLSQAEAHARLLTYGPNRLKKESRLPLWVLFLTQFTNVSIIILTISSIISLALGEVVEGVAILVTIFVTATIATSTEYTSGNALDALAKLSDPSTTVFRDGEKHIVHTPDLVPGDIVIVNPGDIVPADCRLLEANNLKVIEMILTGEALEVSKVVECDSASASTKLTLPNAIYSSTSVVEGRGVAVVLLTGMNSRVGSIASLLHDAHTSPLSPDKKPIKERPISREVWDVEGFELEEEDELEPPKEEVVKVESTCKCTAFDFVTKFVQSQMPKQTPLQKQLHDLGILLTTFAVCSAVLIFIVGVLRGFRDPNHDDVAPWLQSLMLSVSLAISAIPEGLPLVVVISLALGTNTMAKRNTLVRRLPAVETLGSTSVICTDKTGTLTSGKMMVTKVLTISQQYDVTGDGFNPKVGSITRSGSLYSSSVHAEEDDIVLHMTLLGASLCCNAIVKEIEGQWRPIGTSTEAALVVAAHKYGFASPEIQSHYQRLHAIPFDSRTKLMCTIHALPSEHLSIETNSFQALKGNSNGIVLLKGAPQVLLTTCSTVLMPSGKVEVLTEAMKRVINVQADKYASTGLRILAIAYKLEDNVGELLEALLGCEGINSRLATAATNMVFVGLIGMMDPPRIGVKRAVNVARKGGIRTVMITGDYLKTAVAIAKMVNILEPQMDEEECAVDCSVLRPDGAYLLESEIDSIIFRTVVFARAKPDDKIEIVKSFQRQNVVVAMTGDGVNDAPALQRANIGIAMGLNGSEVAKAASDMILTDDKFSSIVDAVELGRTIYLNLRKFVMYLIGTNWSQVLVLLVCVLMGIPSPLEPLQILFINLITDGMPAVTLSLEQPESDIMRDPPRKKNAKIMSGVVITSIFRHGIILVAYMIFIYIMGLWWNVGEIFLSRMYEEDNDTLISTCSHLTASGTWQEAHGNDCVRKGLTIARTMVFLTLAFAETFRPLTARSFSQPIQKEIFANKYMTVAIASSIICILIVVFVPGVKDIFKLHTPSWYEWLLVFVGVIFTIVADEILKGTLREERRLEHKWTKLFRVLKNMTRDVNNVRLHLTKFEHTELDAEFGKDMMNHLKDV